MPRAIMGEKRGGRFCVHGALAVVTEGVDVTATSGSESGAVYQQMSGKAERELLLSIGEARKVAAFGK